MNTNKRLSRRNFLGISAAAGASVLITAYTGAATPSTKVTEHFIPTVLEIAVILVSSSIAIVSLNGSLNARSAEEVKQTFKDLVEQGVTTVIVDLKDVPFIDSSGLAALVSGLKTLGGEASNLKLAALQSQARLLFELTMFDRVFEIYETVADALNSLGVSTALTEATSPTAMNGPISAQAAGGIDALIAAANTEGTLNTAVPLHAWKTYGHLFSDFKAKYPAITLAATFLA